MPEIFAPIRKKVPPLPSEKQWPMPIGRREIKPLSKLQYFASQIPLGKVEEIGGFDPTSLVSPIGTPGRVHFASLAKKYGSEAKSLSDMIEKLMASSKILGKRLEEKEARFLDIENRIASLTGSIIEPKEAILFSIFGSIIDPVTGKALKGVGKLLDSSYFTRGTVNVLSRGVALRQSLARELEYGMMDLGLTFDDIMKSPILKEFDPEKLESLYRSGKSTFTTSYKLGNKTLVFPVDPPVLGTGAYYLPDVYARLEWSGVLPPRSKVHAVPYEIFQKKRKIEPYILPASRGGDLIIRDTSKGKILRHYNPLEKENFLHEFAHSVDFSTMDFKPVRILSQVDPKPIDVLELVNDPVEQVYRSVKDNFRTTNYYARRYYGSKDSSEFFATLLEYPEDPLIDYTDYLRAKELQRIYKPLIDEKFNAFRTGRKARLLPDNVLDNIGKELEKSIKSGIIGDIGDIGMY